MEANTPEMAKTLCQIIKKGVVPKSKFILELHHVLMTRGKILKKALNDVAFRHHYHLLLPSPASCRSRDVAASYISPRPLRDYEFSCSNTPASKYNNNSKRRRRPRPTHFPAPACKIINHYSTCDAAPSCEGETASEASPLFGTVARQVRITDSPFQVKETGSNGGGGEEEGCHVVDKEAEKFIERFYKELRLQKLMAAREAAYLT